MILARVLFVRRIYDCNDFACIRLLVALAVDDIMMIGFYE
jgi:hypothetical protein